MHAIQGTSATFVTGVESEWHFLGGGGVSGRAALELTQLSSGLEVITRYRTAAVRTDEPGAWIDLGTAVTAAGLANARVTALDLSTNSDLWIQFGAGARTTATGSDGNVALQTTLFSRANLVGRASFVLSGGAGWIPVGKPQPLARLSDLVFGIVSSGVGATGATLTLSPTWRLIKCDGAAPEAWATTVLATKNFSGFVSEDNWNPGRLSVGTVPTDRLLFQPGIQYSGTNPTATVHALVAALYS